VALVRVTKAARDRPLGDTQRTQLWMWSSQLVVLGMRAVPSLI